MTHKARKRFGQNFLQDTHVIDNILMTANPERDEHWVEIGPGQGALTAPLLTTGVKLDLIELDRDLVSYLAHKFANEERLTLHSQDALTVDFSQLATNSTRLHIIGNLPYNISTPILFHLLNNSSCIRQMIFMLQKEVADRICADAGSKTYGRLSVMVQSVCETQKLFDVSPGSFTPQPKVESTVLKLSPEINKYPQILIPDIFKLIVRTAFSKRRKTIRNALKGIINEELLLSVAIDPFCRPETISVASYITLANKMAGNQ